MASARTKILAEISAEVFSNKKYFRRLFRREVVSVRWQENYEDLVRAELYKGWRRVSSRTQPR